MKKIVYLSFVCFFMVLVVFVSCKQSETNKETIIKGKTTLLVDETIKPIIEDQIAVFESTYNAQIILQAKSEKEVIQAFLKDTSRLAVLSRELNSDEIKFFEQLKIKPKTTKIATDAIALISNKTDSDTLIDMKDVVSFLKGDLKTKIQGLVFDNPNSSTYNAQIILQAKSEKEVIQAFLKDTSRLAVLSRELNSDEIKFFEQLKIKPKTTKIATDAIALISNKTDSDTLIDMKDVVSFLKGDIKTKIQGLVFDNPNSSTVRYLTAIAGVKEIPQKGVYSFKSNEEVVKFVAGNKGMIGVVGINWLLQPTVNIKDYLTNINVLSVKGLNKNAYFAPTQNNLAEGTYPLARDLFIVNCQGYSGLGMGFASFLAGEIGQRIMLKSGMLPTTIPGRKILIKSKLK